MNKKYPYIGIFSSRNADVFSDTYPKTIVFFINYDTGYCLYDSYTRVKNMVDTVSDDWIENLFIKLDLDEK